MKDFLYLIHPFRHGFFDSPTPEEEQVMEQHLQYLQAAAQDGSMVLAGPCLDDTFGLVVFRAEDEASAISFMVNDPSVKAGVMMAELHPMRISLTGKLGPDR